MAEHSNYQKKVIQRYYENRDTIALQKLSELVSELYLVDSEKKSEKLWERARQQMIALGVEERLANHICNSENIKLLAQHLQEWTKNPPKK